MYIYVYICIHVYTYICIYIYIYTYMYIQCTMRYPLSSSCSIAPYARMKKSPSSTSRPHRQQAGQAKRRAKRRGWTSV